MANSKLLKNAIADAKAVRETAIANAKIALEEAFTPRLQSILSQKLQQEMEEEDEDEEDVNEEYGSEDAPTGQSSKIGKGENGTESGTDGKQPSGDATQAHTDLDPETGKISDKVGTEDDNVTVVKEGEEDENGDGVKDDPTGAIYNEEDEITEEDYEEEEDELDLESIIRELEAELSEDDDEEEFEDEEGGEEVFVGAGDDEGVSDIEDEPVADMGMEDDDEMEMESDDEMEMDSDEDEIDLDEILREMGYGDDEEEVEEEVSEAETEAIAVKEAELEEAYKVIKSLKGTINEVNLLNAKLLYSNKLFRNYEMTNEQKMKVVETLDRTANVREVKLVFATLAESMKYNNNTPKKRVKKITESFASDVVKSTAPKKEIISESNDMAKRFQELANIRKTN
ncbi:MAG: hypothetical protein KJP21_05740 [Bacteroidia bacterium]|nr:hypothetical protein [Bacteroidia bacterium]